MNPRALLLIACLGVTASAAEPEARITLLTSLQATYSIATALVEGTAFTVHIVVGPRVRMARQAAHFDSPGSGFPDHAVTATAVIGIGSVWAGDPLYERARRHNIRVIPIDATMPLDGDAAGVSVLPRRDGSGTLPHAWLSPVNGMRMAEIVAADLRRLSPRDAARIDANLDQLKQRLFAIKRDGDACMALVDVPAVVALAEEFAYLTDAMNVEVVDYFLDSDEQWTGEDTARLHASVTESAAPVVIHKWQPRGPALAAIESSGAKLVVLDTMDPPGTAPAGGIDPDGYASGLVKNLQYLCRALGGKSQ